MTLTLQPPLQFKLDAMVRFWRKPAEKIIEEALDERLELLNSQKLDAEIAAFEQMHPELKQRYFNQFVAIHEEQVVDSDVDFEPLFLRMQGRFGDIVVLGMKKQSLRIEVEMGCFTRHADNSGFLKIL